MLMAATAAYDSAAAMLLAFPRAWLVVVLWIVFIRELNPPMPRASAKLGFSAALGVLALAGFAFAENRKWASDAADGATLVPRASAAVLNIQPRFAGGRLVTPWLSPHGFNNVRPESCATSSSPDSRWA